MSEHEPLIRVMALHSLAYCERLFYLEEVEGIRVADASVYAGRSLDEELDQDEGERPGEWVSVKLASMHVGLVSRTDSSPAVTGCLFRIGTSGAGPWRAHRHIGGLVKIPLMPKGVEQTKDSTGVYHYDL